MINSKYRQPLPNTQLDYFDTQSAVEAIRPGAHATLPYTARVLAGKSVRRCPADNLPPP